VNELEEQSGDEGHKKQGRPKQGDPKGAIGDGLTAGQPALRHTTTRRREGSR
jgi:hypothetical protein